MCCHPWRIEHFRVLQEAAEGRLRPAGNVLGPLRQRRCCSYGPPARYGEPTFSGKKPSTYMWRTQTLVYYRHRTQLGMLAADPFHAARAPTCWVIRAPNPPTTPWRALPPMVEFGQQITVGGAPHTRPDFVDIRLFVPALYSSEWSAGTL